MWVFIRSCDPGEEGLQRRQIYNRLAARAQEGARSILRRFVAGLTNRGNVTTSTEAAAFVVALREELPK